MIGEVAVGGVLVPRLLLLAVAALAIAVLLRRPLDMLGFYRFVAWRPVVDLALYLLVLGLVVASASLFGAAR